MMVTGFEEPPPRVPNLAPEHGSSTKPQGSQLEAEEKPVFEDLYPLYDPSVIQGRDEWDRENTTPNTPFWRRGWR
jgi:hypothetical protein